MRRGKLDLPRDPIIRHLPMFTGLALHDKPPLALTGFCPKQPGVLDVGCCEPLAEQLFYLKPRGGFLRHWEDLRFRPCRAVG